MLYLSIYAMLVVLGIGLGHSRRANLLAYNALVPALAIFVAFRFEVGCDWSGYFNQFEIAGLNASLGLPQNQRETLWWSLLTLQQWLELPYYWINIIPAVVLFAGLHAIAKRQPDRLNFLAFAFPILIMNMGFTQFRQGLAIGIICFALIAFQQRRTVRFTILTIVAAGFHSSALAFLLLLPLIPGKLSVRNLLLASILALPGLYFLVTSDAADLAVQRYVARDVEAAGALLRIALLVLTSGAFLLFLQRRWRHEYPEDFKMVYVGTLLMLLPLPLAIYSSVIGDRFGYYLVPIQAMIFARVHYLLPRGGAIISIALHGMLLAFLLVWVSLSAHFAQCYVPYKTWLFGIPSAQQLLY
jgi:hypothetical protein